MTVLVSLLLASGWAWPRPSPPPEPAPVFEVDAPAPGVALDEKVLEPGLKLLAGEDVNGLGAEAARVDAWRTGRAGVRLVVERGAWRLQDDAGERTGLTPGLGAALRRMNLYFGLTAETLARPITPAELGAALVSPRTAARVAELFEAAMAESLIVAGKAVVPEIGGEAALDGGVLCLHRVDDPLRSPLKELLARRDDLAGLRRLYSEQPDAMARLDPQKILARHLETRARWDAEDRVPVERRDALLTMTVNTVTELAAGHYTWNFRTQLENMVRTDWAGRYAGNWHLHPPDAGTAGWLDSVPPSEADYEAAAKAGQELVFVFLTDGYDAYDMSEIGSAPPFQTPHTHSFRSPAWRARFQAAFDRLPAAQ